MGLSYCRNGCRFPLVAWMTSARVIAPFDADAQASPAVRTCGAVRSTPAAWIICTDKSPWAFGSGNPLMPRPPQAAREREQLLAVNPLLLSLGREVRIRMEREDPAASLLRRLELRRGAISLRDVDRHLRAVARVRYDWVREVGYAVVAHAGGVLVGVRTKFFGGPPPEPLDPPEPPLAAVPP